MALSAALSAASMTVGLTVSYLAPSLPPSFSIIVTAAIIYALSFVRAHFRGVPVRSQSVRARGKRAFSGYGEHQTEGGQRS